MTDYRQIIKALSRLSTEQVNLNSLEIDQLPAAEIVRLINKEDKKVADVVSTRVEGIAQAAQIYADTLKNDGRVFYVGAGTSGRLGVLDAAECPPTFGTDPMQIIGVISGGYETLVLSKEGVEDNREAAIDDLKRHHLTNRDFVIGIAASIRTPYTQSGLIFAKSIGCKTAFIVCNRWEAAQYPELQPDIVIDLEVGPEIITGSTRMKSGTAQKMTLNMISTTAMVLLGKTFGNLMVDLQAKSDKLAARSRKILMELFGIDVSEAERLLSESEGSVKMAVVMKQWNCDAQAAQEKLSAAGGFIARIK